MADFFKGLAGGFQTGLQFSEARRRNQEYQEQLAEREQARQIFNAQQTITPGRAATPEQIQRAGLETERLQTQDIADFGLSAEEAARYAPQMPSEQATTTPTTYSFGGLTRQTPFSADELNRMRMQQLIPVIAPRNTAMALQLQNMLTQDTRQQAAEARLAEMFPLQKQALQGQIESGALSRRQAELQIQEAERQARDRQQADQFSAQLAEARRQNPNMTSEDMYRMAREANLSTEQQFRVLQNITGIDEALFKQGQRDVERMIRGKGLDGIVDQFNKSDLIGPGRNYRVDRDPKSGAVSLTLIDAATGNAVGGAQRFANEGEATGYLARLARDPSTVGEYVTNLEVRRAQVDYYKSQANRNDAIANASRSLTPEQANELNNLSADIDAAREAGDDAKAKRLTEQFDLKYRTFAGQMGRVIQPRAAAAERPDPIKQKAIETYFATLKSRFELGREVPIAERSRLARDLGLKPSDVNLGLPDVQQGAGGGGGGADERGGGGTTPPALVRSTAERIAGREPTEAAAPPNSAAAIQQERAMAEQQRTVGLLGREQQRASAQGLVDQLLYRGLNASNISQFMSPQEARSFFATHGEFLPPDVQRAMRVYAAGIR